jgi:hypothetical protein
VPSRKNVANFSHIAASVHSVQYNEFSGAEGDSRNRWWEIGMDDRTARAALMYHWDASDAGDLELEHEIYREDAVLDYPHSGERIRHKIQVSRTVQPNKKRFTVRRIRAYL